jgi:outer membrane protein, heavy metal efflux system
MARLPSPRAIAAGVISALIFMKLSILSCSFTGLLIALSPLNAAPGVVVTLDSAAARVRAENPDLAAARLLIREAQGRLHQAGRLENPQLGVSIEHDRRWAERRVEIGVSQRFPVTHRLAMEKEAGISAVNAAEAEVREIERGLIAETRGAVVQVLAIRQRRDLVERQAKVSQEWSDFLAEAAARGEGSALAVGQAKLESASLVAESRQIAAMEAAALGKLKPLIGLLPTEPLHVSGALPEPVVPGGLPARGQRPDLQRAAWESHAAGQAAAIQLARRHEDLEAGVFAASERTEDAPRGYDTEAVIGFQLRVPLPFWNRNEGAIDEARARQQRKEMELAALGRQIDLEMAAAREEMAAWLQLVREVDETLLPLAAAEVDAAENAVREGTGEIQVLFRNRERSLQLAITRLDALREFHLARVRYESALAIP